MAIDIHQSRKVDVFGGPSRENVFLFFRQLPSCDDDVEEKKESSLCLGSFHIKTDRRPFSRHAELHQTSGRHLHSPSFSPLVVTLSKI